MTIVVAMQSLGEAATSVDLGGEVYVLISCVHQGQNICVNLGKVEKLKIYFSKRQQIVLPLQVNNLATKQYVHSYYCQNSMHR